MRDVINALHSMELNIQETKYFKIFFLYTSGNENNTFTLLFSTDLIFNVAGVLRKLVLKIICWNSCAWTLFCCHALTCSLKWKRTGAFIS